MPFRISLELLKVHRGTCPFDNLIRKRSPSLIRGLRARERGKERAGTESGGTNRERNYKRANGSTIPNKTDEKCKRKVCVYRFGFSPEQLL